MAIPPIDDMPKITLEKDDLESFQRSRAQTGKSPAIDKSSSDVAQGSSRSPSWLMFIVIIAILGGGAGYLSMQQHKQITLAQARIAELERRLSATGEEMDQSTVALGVKVSELSQKTQELWDQMDKLWASAWRRNQSEIGDLSKALTTLKANTDAKDKNLSGQASELDKQLKTLSNQLSQYAGNIEQVGTSVTEVKQSSINNEQQIASLTEKLISTALGNNNLTNKVDDLELKLKNLEKSLQKPALTVPGTP